jgi:hypothetical protein
MSQRRLRSIPSTSCTAKPSVYVQGVRVSLSRSRSAEVLERYSKFGTLASRIGRVRSGALRTGERPDPPDAWRPQALARRLSTGDLVQMEREYLAGDGCTILSRRYGVSENAVLAHLRRVGLVVRSLGKVTLDDVTEMRRLRSRGWTYQSIGERFGITRTAVSRRLQDSLD